jgi:uncharacterized protein YbaP (TraB family)
MKVTKVLLASAVFCLALASQGAAPADAKQFFWKVTGGKGVIYLLGTIHVGTKDLYPLAPIIEDSFKGSDTLVEEIDLSDPNPQKLAQDIVKRAVYPDGDSAINHLSDETRTVLGKYVLSGQLGPNYMRVKPWLLSLYVMQLHLKKMGLEGAKGLDLHFSEEAKKMHKPIAGLETANFQINMFSSFSDKLQDQLLLMTLLDANKGKESVDSMFEAWRAGDADAMEAAIAKQTQRHPNLEPVMVKLFDERNDAMARQIDQFLQTPKAYFIAVGAGHLVGRRGILSQLRDKGYKIEQP